MEFAAFYEPPLEQVDRPRGLRAGSKLRLVPGTQPRPGSVHAVAPDLTVMCGTVEFDDLVNYGREWSGILGSAACRACLTAVQRAR